MKKAVYLVLSLGTILFLGFVFYGNGIAQANLSDDVGDDLVVDAYAYEIEVIETTEEFRPRNNERMMRDDCPYREEGRYLDEDCPFQGVGRRRMSDDTQETQGSGGRRRSNSERPCSRRR